MYTGTLISDLMAIVDRVDQRAERQQSAEQQELHAIFAMQIPSQGDRVFMGAA
jgi:hypothetical protein